uniref:Mitochondrial MinC n=1 Tax=Stygiella incarcerata TaxID=1712417 RepID=A0A0E3ST17_9EUKA|nr:mitochondrial MinC [Stygiella incarcerata]
MLSFFSFPDSWTKCLRKGLFSRGLAISSFQFPSVSRKPELKFRTFFMPTISASQNLEETLHYVQKKSEMSKEFFRGVPVVLDLKAFANTDVDMDPIEVKNCYLKLRLGIESMGLIVAGVTNVPNALRIAQKEGDVEGWIAVLTESSSPSASADPSMQPPPFSSQGLHGRRRGDGPLIHEGNVRSGQQVVNAVGDIIVVGNVHSGAEVKASGNICVMGKLAGRAMAGSAGDSTSYILSQKFQAEFLSIGMTYTLCEEVPDGVDPDCPTIVKLDWKSREIVIQSYGM